MGISVGGRSSFSVRGDVHVWRKSVSFLRVRPKSIITGVKLLSNSQFIYLAITDCFPYLSNVGLAVKFLFKDI